MKENVRVKFLVIQKAAILCRPNPQAQTHLGENYFPVSQNFLQVECASLTIRTKGKTLLVDVGEISVDTTSSCTTAVVLV